MFCDDIIYCDTERFGAPLHFVPEADVPFLILVLALGLLDLQSSWLCFNPNFLSLVLYGRETACWINCLLIITSYT